MLLNKEKLIKNEWVDIDRYLKKDNSESMKLAVIEVENVFLKVVRNKGYKAKKIEDQIALAISEIRRPESFLKSRERALKVKNEPGYNIIDPYGSREIIENYREALEDILFGIIDEKKMQSFKYRFWDFYYPIFSRRRKIYKFVVVFLVILALMLFIADTYLGESIFNFLIDQIHFILRIILFSLFLVFLVVFFIAFSVIILESRSKKRAEHRK